MRARNIKPGFFSNEDIVQCSMAARLLFIGLWCLADREGRLENRPIKIKIAIFPCDNVDINNLLDELCSFHFIEMYEVDGKKYIQVVNFHKHQKPHPKEKPSVIPINPQHLNKFEPRCEQDTTKECSSPADILNPDILNVDILNVNTSCPEQNCSEQQSCSEPENKDPQIFISLPLSGKGFHDITESSVIEFERLFPSVDVRQEIRSMYGWLIGNPTKRKTKRGVTRFVSAWLLKAQDGTRKNENAKRSFRDKNYYSGSSVNDQENCVF